MSKEEYKVAELNLSGARGNRFKFRGFNERIAHIDVDVFHRIIPVAQLVPSLPFASSEESNNKSEELVETPSWFRATLLQWHHRTLNAHWIDFFNRVNLYCKTLPELLYHRHKVFNAILEHLKVPNSLALQPILELIAGLAKDLRRYAHEYVPDIIATLVKLIDIKDTNLLEWIFSCIGFLFKYLDKELLPQLPEVFDRYTKPLLLHSRPFIREFSAESFAFLIRKLNPSSTVFSKLVLQTILPSDPQEKPSEAACAGFSALLFASLKGVAGHFHSKMVPIFLFCLKHLQTVPYRVEVLKGILQLMADYCRGDDQGAKDVWTCFEEYFQIAGKSDEAFSKPSTKKIRISESLADEVVVDL